jgi:acyl-CoA thioesterase FadM
MFFRLLALVLTARLRRRAHILGPCRTPFRVLPTDIDVLRHMNNGVYFSIFDLARIDLLSRSGLLAKLRKRGWYAVVAAETGSFRKSLELFQRFDVVTSVVGWDERHVYFEHRVLRHGRVTTSAVIQLRFLARSGERLTPDQVMRLLPEPPMRPELPEWIGRWGKDAYEHAIQPQQMPEHADAR